MLLGSNLGNREEHLRKALERISKSVGKITGISTVYMTEPWGMKSDHDFLNLAVIVESDLHSEEILHQCLQIEIEMGRQRSLNSTDRYVDRIIDIDLIAHGTTVISTPNLTLPHPRIESRRFVLEPINQLVPHWQHPASLKSIDEMLLDCPEHPKVYPTSSILAP